MGCDITYYFDHDLIGLSAQDFLANFKRRVAPLPVVLTGLPEVYPNMDWDKGSPYRHNATLPNCWEIDCFLYDFETQYNSKEDCINIRLHHKIFRIAGNFLSMQRQCAFSLLTMIAAFCMALSDGGFSVKSIS